MHYLYYKKNKWQFNGLLIITAFALNCRQSVAQTLTSSTVLFFEGVNVFLNKPVKISYKLSVFIYTMKYRARPTGLDVVNYPTPTSQINLLLTT